MSINDPRFPSGSPEKPMPNNDKDHHLDSCHNCDINPKSMPNNDAPTDAACTCTRITLSAPHKYGCALYAEPATPIPTDVLQYCSGTGQPVPMRFHSACGNTHPHNAHSYKAAPADASDAARLDECEAWIKEEVEGPMRDELLQVAALARKGLADPIYWRE